MQPDPSHPIAAPIRLVLERRGILPTPAHGRVAIEVVSDDTEADEMVVRAHVRSRSGVVEILGPIRVQGQGSVTMAQWFDAWKRATNDLIDRAASVRAAEEIVEIQHLAVEGASK
jgi:anion-transporting  ArsA/GET3 family ATPase